MLQSSHKSCMLGSCFPPHTWQEQVRHFLSGSPPHRSHSGSFFPIRNKIIASPVFKIIYESHKAKPMETADSFLNEKERNHQKEWSSVRIGTKAWASAEWVHGNFRDAAQAHATDHVRITCTFDLKINLKTCLSTHSSSKVHQDNLGRRWE